MLTKEQTDRVAAILNRMVDIPFLTEEMERPILQSAVALIVDNITGLLPEQIRTIMEGYLNTQDQGIEEENAGVFSENLVRTLNRKLNIPLLGEEEESFIFGHFSDILIKGMVKGETLDSALSAFESQLTM